MTFSLIFLVYLVTTAAAQTTEIIAACGDTSYEGPSGIINSPNYPGNYSNNQNCDYRLNVSTIASLSFVFKSFNTQEGFDFVTIGCPGNSSVTPQEYSGNILPPPVSIPWCDQGNVKFVTDSSIVSTGFSIDYYVSEGGCGNTVHTGPNGYVTSPNYPSFHGFNQNCSNIIWAQQRSTIHLFFQFFDLQRYCATDWLEISCLDKSDFAPIRYCATFTGYSIYIRGCSQMLLWFHSDDFENHQGFNIEYEISTDEAAGCGNTSYYAPSGFINSPNHPKNYDNGLDCYYNIYASTGSSLLLTFKSFNVEASYDVVTISCPTNSSFIPREYYGYTLPDPLSIPWCSQGLVHFRTDYTTVFTGFTLDYSVSLEGDH